VLVDDLVTRGVSEPYRMFTSRAEYRLLLREDNADLRLTPVARNLGLVDSERWQAFERKLEAVATEQQRLAARFIHKTGLSDGDRAILGDGFQRECNAADLLRRPEFRYEDIEKLSAVGAGPWRDGIAAEEAEQIALQLEVQAKYAGYIERQEREIEKHSRQETQRLPEDFDYASVTGLSNEARQRLEKVRPSTLGQASRLEGVTSATISLLLIYLKKREMRRSA
jgi:tRNA uridine 5-carboxymethylaminomethyl modification enzyme